ncbi:hypothetical protein [Amycolatopsis saalfeldensis]|uniref:Uncharacterized protein n=1 Tax=Amycolatopsis saalfeldensis TaxID=394193 RepID=A0A1H8YCC5_9PSEU|nr:hypothetical protein [Amycolatopsis saalfeldensis]SEP49799.1 hypothetical protein SAMN04489732_113205 [Amycolatopsis saalfeldensis]
MWDWVGLGGEFAGGYGAAKVIGVGVKEAAGAAAAGHIPYNGGQGGLNRGIEAANKEGAAIAPAWEESGSGLANRLDKSEEWGQSAAAAGQGAAGVVPQIPTIIEQTGGNTSDDSKNLATTGSIYDLLGKAR